MAAMQYPKLSKAEIVAAYNQIHSVKMDSSQKISNNDLVEGQNGFLKPDKIQRVFINLLKACIEDFTEDQLDQPILGAHQQQYEDLHSESNRLSRMALFIQRVLVACLFKDFTMMDLVEPRSARTCKCLSAFLNFVTFVDERMDNLRYMKEQQSYQEEKYQCIVKENDELRLKIAEIKAQHEQKKIQQKEFGEEMEAKTIAVQEKERKGQELHLGLTAVQEEISKRKNKLAQLQERIAGAKVQSAQLSNQIVSSPERVKHEQEQKVKQLEKLKLTCNDKTDRLKELTSQNERIDQINKEMDTAMRTTAVIKESSDEFKSVESEIGRLNEHINDGHEKHSQTKRNIELQQRQACGKQERMDKMRLQNHVEIKRLQDEVQHLSQRAEQRSQSVGVKEGEMTALRQKTQALQEQRELLLSQHDSKMTKMDGKYAELMQGLEGYHERFADVHENNTKKLDKAMGKYQDRTGRGQ